MWEGITFTNGGAVALVTVFVVAILRGWLVPRPVLQDAVAQRDARIVQLEEERDRALATAERREQQLWKVAMPVAETTARVLDGLPRLEGEGPVNQ